MTVFVIMEVNVEEPIFIIVDRLNRMVAPVDSVGHIKAEVTVMKPSHEPLPLVRAVYQMASVRVKGNGDAEGLGIKGEVFIDGSHPVQVIIGGRLIETPRPLGHKGGHLKFRGKFDSAFIDFVNWSACAEGDVGATNGSNFYADSITEPTDATG